MDKRILGLKVTGPQREGDKVYPSVIGWALISQSADLKVGISEKEVANIALKMIGSYLKEVREQNKISIETVAAAIKCSNTDIESIECGTKIYDMVTFFKIINALDCFFYIKEREGQHLNIEALKSL